MNILGKVLLWLILPLAAAATALAARTLQIRNSWTKPVAELATDNTKLESELAGLRDEVGGLRVEMENVNYAWEGVWTRRSGEMDRTRGTLLAGIGQADGVGVAPRLDKSIIYVFRDEPDGKSAVYLGAFRPMIPTESRTSTLQPAWMPIRDDYLLWKTDKLAYRYRSNVPTARTAAIDSLYSQLRLSSEQIVRLGKDVQVSKAAIDDSQSAVEHYEVILRGDPQAGGGGLLLKLADGEEARNIVLGDVDELRRAVYKPKLYRDNLIAGNEKLLKFLIQKKNTYSSPQ